MREDFIEIPVISRKLPFAIHMAGTSYCDKTYRISRPNSAVFCMEYILSGKGVLKTQGKTFYPQKGDTYMCLPRDTHEYYSGPDDPWVKIQFNATGPLIDHLVDMYNLRNHTVFHCNSEKFIRNIHSVLSDKSLPPKQISEHTSILFHQLIQFLSNNIEDMNTYSVEATTLKNYIDSRICTNISIEELSALINKNGSTQAVELKQGIPQNQQFCGKEEGQQKLDYGSRKARFCRGFWGRGETTKYMKMTAL